MQPADRLARRRQPLRSSAVRDLLADAHRPGMISLAGGLPAADLFDSKVFSTLAADLLAHSPQEALQYGLTAGQPRLQAAVRVLVKERGIVAPPTFFFGAESDAGVSMKMIQEFEIDLGKVLHGEQGIILHKPLPATGTVIGRTRVTEIVDRLNVDRDVVRAALDELGRGGFVAAEPDGRFRYAPTDAPTAARMSRSRRRPRPRSAGADCVPNRRSSSRRVA